MAGKYRQRQAVRIDCQRINVLLEHTTVAEAAAALGRTQRGAGGGGDRSRVGRKNGALLPVQSAAAETAGESPGGVLLCLATPEPKYLPAHLWWIAVLLRARADQPTAAARGGPGTDRNRSTGRIPPSGRLVVRVKRIRRSQRRSCCSLNGTNDKV